MAKFYGAIGYAFPCETTPGVWTDNIIERNHRGDILQNMNRWQPSGNVNDNVVIDNKISIIADPFITENCACIRYVCWMGARWKVNNIEILRPRLLLTFGGVYNGSTPGSA